MISTQRHRSTIQIDALPAFNDNYIWLLQDAANRRYAVVNPGDAKPVKVWLAAHPNWRLSDILVAHHYHDHVGGVTTLKELTGARVLSPANEEIPARDLALEDGERAEVFGLVLEIFHVPGHTLGHIAYYHPAETPLLFYGDTLFAAGCGRLFEGAPAQMHHSLARLAAPPANTRVYCTHEYMPSNLRFALAMKPDSTALQERFEEATRSRERDRTTLPSEISLELSTNPFLRVSENSVKKKADQQSGQQNRTPEEVFAVLGAWKDQF